MVQRVGFDGMSMGGNRESGSESSCSACSDQFQNSMHESFNSSCHHDEISEAANKRLKQTPMHSNQKAQMAQTLLSLPPLGLSLGKTPSFLDLKEQQPCRRKTKRAAAAEVNVQSMSEKEKLKASNFGALLLRIGSWQRVTENEGDLVAKCYYAKRKLVWEILDKGLKSKIELQWSDIIAIRAFIKENQRGILEIELGQPPTFHRESDPQPRKHTMWNAATDFTGGEALKHRRHYLEFPPGLLDRHYEKLLQCESRFFEMNQRPFPSQRSPYFQSYNGGADISFEYSSHGAVIPSNLPFQFPAHLDPREIQAYEQTNASLCYRDSTSPVSVMDFSSRLDEVIGNQGVENQCMPSSYPPAIAYLLSRDHAPQPVFVEEAHFNPGISCQNFNEPIGYDQESRSDFRKQLLNHLQMHRSNNSLDSSMAYPENLNSEAFSGIQQTGYDQGMSANANLIPGASDHSHHTGQALPLRWVTAPLSNSWCVSPQVVPLRHSGLHPGDNNLRYPSADPNPTTEDFASFNNSMNPWR